MAPNVPVPPVVVVMLAVAATLPDELVVTGPTNSTVPPRFSVIVAKVNVGLLVPETGAAEMAEPPVFKAVEANVWLLGTTLVLPVICNVPPPSVRELIAETMFVTGEFVAVKSKVSMPSFTARPLEKVSVTPPSISVPAPVFIKPAEPAMLVLMVAD